MRQLTLVLALILVAAVPGCIDGGIDGLWEDLEAKDTFTEAELLNTTASFDVTGILDPTNPPEGEEGLADAWSETFTVPDGTRRMTVRFSVTFDEPEPEGSPVTPPRGEITFNITAPAAGTEEESITFEQSAAAGLDFTGPTPGEWTVAFAARGEGNVRVLAQAVVPVVDDDAT